MDESGTTLTTVTTLTLVEPKILPNVAVMDADPKSVPVASPVLLTVALEGSDDVQVTCVVRS